MYSLSHRFCKLSKFGLNCVKNSAYYSHKTHKLWPQAMIDCRSMRQLSTDNEKSNEESFVYEIPPLMRFTPKGMPNVLYALKNRLIVYLYLKPFLDKDFDLKSFLLGAKQALSSISSNLANDNIHGIQDMLTEEAYEEVSKNFREYSSQQKRLLKVDTEDVLFCFPYNIQIERQSSDAAVVRILVVFDCIPGFQDIIHNEMANKNLRLFDINKYLENKICCNYEFIRHYMKGRQSEWIVSKLLHIKDRDLLRMYGLFRK
ncbi:unnamed protein product [Oppiella nova]|uniref:Tim44-like domain-containing protein n=1 Tax=Oppiella nova TaxID=334625 RepID=A0A7R9MCM7_9ACAR|nr:unnamed protein product [Oppiella nova]CAG2174734.1 unnamed protein product [Oppiella nova]